ncbi:alcohol oxidase [Ascobolus immersus RN42]|uniref:Alcohol oxidase n=1 Tax=Ascobolus immersus RN42 TaxID=1160509 RepID=A0A3N4HNX5_ASCIM|nr:alcohol oxidase [Ascobolus immersus RN42]
MVFSKLTSPSTLLSLLIITTSVYASPKPFRTHITNEADLLPSYSYIIVGGGTSGLVLASRLSEDPSNTVLIIEAGPLVEPVPEQLLYPGWSQLSLFNSSIMGPYRYPSFPSAPEEALNNRTSEVAAARVVGGGSAINGMVFLRGSKRDYDSWGVWDYNKLLPYFKKSETFIPPSPEQERQGITWDKTNHGFNGPIQVSFPNGTYPAAGRYLEAIESLGPKRSVDTSTNAVGTFWMPSSLDAGRQERSYAYNGYLQPLMDKRKNLHLLSQRTVTKILSGKKTGSTVPITGVEFAASEAGKKYTVKAKKGVILAAGALHTPQILQLSGIGNPKLLEPLGIKTVIDLPGVGENLQDHPYVSVPHSTTYPTNETSGGSLFDPTFFATAYDLYLRTRTGPFTAGLGNTGAFLSLESITNTTTLNSLLSSIPAGSFLDPSTPVSVKKGWEDQLKKTIENYKRADSAAYEFLPGLVALQHPLSRGTVRLRSPPNPFSRPVVNYRTLSHPLDALILAQGVLFQQKIFKSPVLAYANPVDNSAFAAIDEADIGAILEVMKAQVTASLAHPCGTAGMRAREEGGVVDEKLEVYGAKGLWVVDASVVPLVPGQHIQPTVYAVAERAADVIRGRKV